MLEKLLTLDTELLVYLNGLGSPAYDGLWLFITRQSNWIPLFILLLYVIYKKLGVKQTLYLLLFITVIVAITDQTTNLFKNGFQRLRPCNNPEINTVIRVVQVRNSFSFFSGHAANSMASTMFVFLIIRKFYKHTYLLFLFPLIFAYSRIYLGLHFPGDILTGYLFGGTFGFMFYKSYMFFGKKYNFIK